MMYKKTGVQETKIQKKKVSAKNAILIPILSMEENNKNFLDNATEQAKAAILLFVVDTQNMLGRMGYAPASINKGSKIINEAKEHLLKQDKIVKDIIDWGDTLTKIKNIASLYRIGRIVLKKQNNQWFEEAVKELEKTRLKVEVI